jgi:hypothetical protein
MLTRPTPARRRRRDDWHRSDGGVWLPGDPLRGAGMVRRGMGMGFEPAGCCCDTTEPIEVNCCSETSVPAYVSLTLSGTPEGALYGDGTYILENETRVGGSEGCAWIYGTYGESENMYFRMCLPYVAPYDPVMVTRDTEEPGSRIAWWGGYVSGATGSINNWTAANPHVMGGHIFHTTSLLNWSGARASIYSL